MEFLCKVAGMAKSQSAVDARVQPVASIGSKAAGDELPAPQQNPQFFVADPFVTDPENHFTVFAAAHS